MIKTQITKIIHSVLMVSVLIFISFNPLKINAATINVSSISALQSAINSSVSGDVINLTNGHYTNNTINISKSNITVQAATSGGVYLDGTNAININGNNTTFSGFQFTTGSITGIVITVNGSSNKITQLNFNGYSAQKYINILAPSQYNEISYCNFENKPITAPIGNLIHIDPSATVPGYHKIRYCSFRNMSGAGGDNGNECIRISNGATSTYVSRTVIEYCYFNNTGLGDSESISNKCRENVIRYNTCVDNQNDMFCFRNGDNCVAYGNFFLNAGGIRVKEANNIYCYNNYFENSGVTGTMGSVLYVYYTANTTYVLNNINFIHNTFVDCGTIDFDSGAASNTWANNLFKKSSGKIMIGNTSGISWAGNIYFGTLGISATSGLTSADPQLIKNASGIYVPAATSPAINASNAAYPVVMNITNVDDDPTILTDISGLPRPASAILKDVGCSEFTTGTTINHPLTIDEVGPAYLKSITTLSNPAETNSGLNISIQQSKNETSVQYNLSDASTVSLSVLNINGLTCNDILQNAFQSEGHYTYSLDRAAMQKGIYFVRIDTDRKSETVKFILQ